MQEKLFHLLKTILIFIVYFFYTTLISMILDFCGIHDDVVILFVADLLFFFGIVFLYKDSIKQGFLSFMKDYSLKERVLFVLKWVVILFVINMIGSVLVGLLYPDFNDGNAEAIYSIASLSTIYTIFKTLIFGVVAEELVFKKALREVVKPNWIFIIFSSIIYALVNVIYTHFSLASLISVIPYFLFSLLLSWIFVKHDDNIFMVMLIKFFYNLIPITILLLGIGA